MDKNNQKIFVFGATGYVGQALVLLGVSQNIATIAHLRADSLREDHWAQKWGGQVALDRTTWDLKSLIQTFKTEKPTHVFCCIGTTRARAKLDGGDYFKIDFGYTKMLVEALKEAGLKTKFIYLSSLGANSKSFNPYLQARGLAEEAVINSGLPYLIARPGLITGNNRDEKRPAELMAATVMNGVLGLAKKVGLKQIANRYTSIDNHALAKALLRLAFSNTETNRIVLSEELKGSDG